MPSLLERRRTAEAEWVAADFPADRTAIEAIADKAAQQTSAAAR